jgi:8-amino-7-oxononanoate synthase
LAELARSNGAISYLDEAHTIGVWGDNGRGARKASWDIVIGTLSKALGSQGGFVTGPQVLIDTLVNKARSFIYTTGLSPACVAGAHAALSLIQEDAAPRTQLQQTSQQLRDGLRALGFDTLGSQSQIVPILLGSAERALACSAHLDASGLFAPAIRPPTVPAGECRIRFSVTAEHSKNDIDQLLDALRDWK